METLEKNEAQKLIAALQDNKWTLAAIATALEQSVNTIEKWKAGDRHPANAKSVIAMLEHLLTLKRKPKMKRYAKGSRNWGNKDGQEKTGSSSSLPSD